MAYLPSVFLDRLDRLGRLGRLDHVDHLDPKVLGRAHNYQLAKERQLVLMGSFHLREAIHRLRTISLGRKMPTVDRSHTKDQSM
jgi:hypothetical protein